MDNHHFIVTIDGPAGVGKSTLAKQVAEQLGIGYLDTGAMFRTIGLLAEELRSTLKHDITGKELTSSINTASFTITGAGISTQLWYNEKAIGDEIRSEEAAQLAAKVAVVPEVRDILKKAQQSIGKASSLVAEGRDMGTVVFSDAPCKIFLDASVEERAERRYNQLLEMGKPAVLADIINQISERDAKDRNRKIAPLHAAKDAFIIDTSYKVLDDVFNEVMQYIKMRQDAFLSK